MKWARLFIVWLLNDPRFDGASEFEYKFMGVTIKATRDDATDQKVAA